MLALLLNAAGAKGAIVFIIMPRTMRALIAFTLLPFLLPLLILRIMFIDDFSDHLNQLLGKIKSPGLMVA